MISILCLLLVRFSLFWAMFCCKNTKLNLFILSLIQTCSDLSVISDCVLCVYTITGPTDDQIRCKDLILCVHYAYRITDPTDDQQDLLILYFVYITSTANTTQSPSPADMQRAYEALGLPPPSQGANTMASGGTAIRPTQPAGMDATSGDMAVPWMAVPNKPVKQWHQIVSQELRNHLIYKL